MRISPQTGATGIRRVADLNGAVGVQLGRIGKELLFIRLSVDEERWLWDSWQTSSRLEKIRHGISLGSQGERLESTGSLSMLHSWIPTHLSPDLPPGFSVV